MKLHYMGKYNGDPMSIPAKEHYPGAVKFKEPDSPAELNKVATAYGLIPWIPCGIIFGYLMFHGMELSLLGMLFAFLAMFPHEFLHAICFKEDVYLFQNLKQGMLFVSGPESMSRARFIFMSLLPNLVFGWIPFLVGVLYFQGGILASMGLIAIPMGGGDYMNVVNCIRQVPKGAKVYLHHFNSYWYMPQ